MTEKPPLLVDIVADPLCPWCFVGLHSFLRAKEELSQRWSVRMRMRPYQLNPGLPEEGVDRKAYYEQKFPDAERRAAMREALQENARGLGLDFNFDPGKPKHLPNSLKAHHLLRLAHIDERQEETAIALYAAFWDDGRDIGDLDVLVDIAQSSGMNVDATKASLSTSAEMVAEEANAFRQAGVSGVPTFIINEKTGFSGAMPPDKLAGAIEHAASQ